MFDAEGPCLTICGALEDGEVEPGLLPREACAYILVERDSPTMACCLSITLEGS